MGKPASGSRRKAPPVPDKKLYKVSQKDIRDFIKKERRHDELIRLRRVKAQFRVWYVTLGICGGLILIFIFLAILGAQT